MNDSAQNNQQPNSVPVDTSLGDGMSTPPFPIGGDTSQTPAQPPVQPIQNTINIQSSGAPVSPVPAAEPVIADTTGGNQPTVAAAPPPPGDGQTITTFKPVRGKFGPKGIIATVFGILVLVAATIVGITQVGQTQIFREKAAGLSCEQAKAIPGRCNDLCGGEGQSACNCETSNCDLTALCDPDNQCPSGQRCSNSTCVVENPTGVVCNTQGFAFQTCPDSVVQTNQQSCADLAQAAGCYRTGGNACSQNSDCTAQGGPNSVCRNGTCTNTQTCSQYVMFTCPRANATEAGNVGDCRENATTPSSTSPNPPGNFCGAWQIDCYNGPGFNGGVDTSGCTGPTAPPTDDVGVCGGCDCGRLNGDRTSCIRVVLDDGTTTCTFNEGACTTGGNNGKAKCAGVGLQLNGEFVNKKGKVANGWHTATLAEVQALQAGDKVRITVNGGSASGANPAGMENFTKARVSINSGAFIEFTDHDDTVSKNPNTLGVITARTFRYEYTIPAGVTDFSIQGQVYYRKGQNPGWH